MSAPVFSSLEARSAQLVVDLEFVITTLRDGIAAGGLSVPAQRRLVRDLRDAPRVVSELRGAVEAYRECVTSVRTPSGPTLPVTLDLEARPLHVSDEEIR